MVHQFPFEEVLAKLLNTEVAILSIQPMGGGCINEVQRVMSNKGAFVFKLNKKEIFPRMFEYESKGLSLLAAANCIRVPSVLAYGEEGVIQYLIMEYIPHGSRPDIFWENFGRSLAELHTNRSDKVGLEYQNYIGSLPQVNTIHQNAVDFFRECRLKPMLELAEKKKYISLQHLNQFESLYKKLDSILVNEPASLLHGDLWSGNFISDMHQQPVLIDPAVYYGPREAELAFTTMFGGFDEKFYSSYSECLPIISGFEERSEIYNLYPLLVHLNLFGTSYLPEIEFTLKRFVG